jgi:hypothetical protein
MSDNAEVIKVSEKNAPSSLDSVVGKAVEIVPFKLLMLIFIIYLLLSSDVFNEIILSKLDGAIGFGGKATTYGTIITGVLLVIFVALSDVLIKKSII